MPDLQYEGFDTGKTLHVLFRDASDTVVDLVEGTGDKIKFYTATEAALVAAGLAVGTYSPIVLTGTAAAHDIAVDTLDGTFDPFYFDGTFIVDMPETVATGGFGLVPIAADEVGTARTFFSGVEGYRARNIITLNAWTGDAITLAADFVDVLNADTALLTVDTVTITNDDTQVATAASLLRLHKGLRRANFDIAAISTAGEYTVAVQVTTTDSQPIKLTGKVVVV